MFNVVAAFLADDSGRFVAEVEKVELYRERPRFGSSGPGAFPFRVTYLSTNHAGCSVHGRRLPWLRA